MKAALIPPVPHLDEFGSSSFHLLLAHLLKRPKYKAHYKRERAHNSYLVLDNSAHEKGAGESAEKLMFYAADMRAQEVVVPDVLFDATATVEACISAHEVWYEGGTKIMSALDPALMYVPQGNSVDEWYWCLRELVQIHCFVSRRHGIRRDLVLGISKDYEMWDGGVMNLLNTYVMPMKLDLAKMGVRMPVHLLGWGRDLWALNDIAKEHQWIRSTDSAKPFVYALSNVKLNYPQTPVYPKRPRGYFGKTLSYDQCKIATHNSIQFLKAAGGEL